MEPGERDRVITIEQGTPGKDAAGMPKTAWSTLASVYAAKFDVSGQERVAAGQTSAAYDTRWEIGYRSDMDAELVDVAKLRRIVYQGRVYDIRSASNIHGRAGVELTTLSRSGS